MGGRGPVVERLPLARGVPGRSRLLLSTLCGEQTPCAWVFSGFLCFFPISLFHEFPMIIIQPEPEFLKGL